LVLVLIEPSSAGIFGRLFHRDPDWDTLRVTWGINIASDNVFTKMPLKIKKALEKGYIKEKTGASCSGKFLGERYVKSVGNGIAVLYDHNGYIAGLQAYFPVPNKTDATPSIYEKNSMFIQDEVRSNKSYVLTAYFVDPDIICTTGRSKSDYDTQKAGNALYIQNGLNPLKDYIKVPLYENETIANKWFKGSCFTSMGSHYWHDISKDMSCDKLLPVFLVFNSGKLTGFGWAIQDKVQSSPQFEHPEKDNLGRFFDPKPSCVKDLYTRGSGLTMMHVFMNSKPWNLIC